MDILQKLTQITDTELQNILSHAMRYAHQHSNIATQVEAQKTADPDAEMRNKHAAAIHRDTALLMNELVKKVLVLHEELKPAEEPAQPRKRKSKE